MGVSGQCESDMWSCDLHAAAPESTYSSYRRRLISFSWSPAIPEYHQDTPLCYRPCFVAELGGGATTRSGGSPRAPFA